jgi:hypothetical protein
VGWLGKGKGGFQVGFGQVGNVRSLELRTISVLLYRPPTFAAISRPALSAASCCIPLTPLEYTILNLIGLPDGQVYKNKTLPFPKVPVEELSSARLRSATSGSSLASPWVSGVHVVATDRTPPAEA